MRDVGIAFAVLLLSIAAAGAAYAASDRIYACGSGGTVLVSIVTPNQIKVTVDFPGSDDGKMTLTMDGGGDVGSGFHFVDGEYTVDIIGAKKDKLTYSAPDFGSADCAWTASGAATPALEVTPNVASPNITIVPKVTIQVTPKPALAIKVAPPKPDIAVQELQTAPTYPIAGHSCGGIMRKGPSMDAAKAASLKAGEQLSILEQASPIDEQGYAWFKVKAGSKTGYQWGGILSVNQGKLSGAFVGC